MRSTSDCSIWVRQLYPSASDQGVRVGVAQRGQELVLRAGHGHVVVAVLEAEVAGEAAAPGVEHLEVDARRRGHRAVGVGAEHGVLVAVGLHHRTTVQPAWPAASRAPSRAAAPRACRSARPGGARPRRRAGARAGRTGTPRRSSVRAPATGVPSRSAGRSTSRVRRSTRVAIGSCPVEIQVRPQHTSPVGHGDLEARGLEHGDRRARDGRVERVGEGVRPQQHPAPGVRRRRDLGAASGEPRAEALLGEGRDLPLLGDAAGLLDQPVQPRGRGDPVDQLGPAARSGWRGAPTPGASPWTSGRAGGARRGPRSGGTGTRPCRWPCRRRPGSRSCSPCTPGTGRVRRAPRSSATRR